MPKMNISQEWDAEERLEQNENFYSHSEPVSLNQLFDDPLLNEYLIVLVKANYDVRLAFAKIREALAMRQMSAAKLLPAIDGRIDYNSSKPAGGILSPQGSTSSGGGSGLAGIPLDIKSQSFLCDFDALWELDLFGRTRKEVASATAFIQMQAASYHSLILSLTAEFARIYLELRRSQHLLNLVNEEVRLLNEKTKIIQGRLNTGLDSELIFLDSQAASESVSAELPIYEGQISSLIYQLSILLGKPPQSLFDELNAGRDVPAIKETIPIGFPSELLRRRPDIRYAEREIAKTTADLGVAIADLFPKITLLGNYGYQNLHLGNTRGAGESFGYGGDILTPLFHGGNLRANVRRNQWIRYQAFLSYEQTVLRALEEAESSIANFQKSQKSFQYKKEAYMRYRKRVASTQDLYKNGVANQLQLIDNTLDSINAEKEWVDAMIDSEIQLIALYKALGGV